MDAKDLPDLDHVEETIAAAREAKDKPLDRDTHATNPPAAETAPTDNDIATTAARHAPATIDAPRTESPRPRRASAVPRCRARW